MNRSTSRGCLWMNIIVVAGLGALVFAQAVTEVARARETANRVKCAQGLHMLGRALMQYAQDDGRGRFPRTVYSPTAPLSFGFDTSDGAKPADPFGPDHEKKVNDVNMAMFLVHRTQDIASNVFICPSSDGKPDTHGTAAGANAINKVSFSSAQNLRYSIANMYPATNAISMGYKWNNTLSAEFVLMADINPGKGAAAVKLTSSKDEMAAGNSPNHDGEGQNVLYADGHVAWNDTPFCGMKKDNIYTVSAGDGEKEGGTSDKNIGSPNWAGDSVLLPVGEPKKPAAATPPATGQTTPVAPRTQPVATAPTTGPAMVAASQPSTQPSTQPASGSGSSKLLWIIGGLAIAALAIIAGSMMSKKTPPARA